MSLLVFFIQPSEKPTVASLLFIHICFNRRVTEGRKQEKNRDAIQPSDATDLAYMWSARTVLVSSKK